MNKHLWKLASVALWAASGLIACMTAAHVLEQFVVALNTRGLMTTTYWVTAVWLTKLVAGTAATLWAAIVASDCLDRSER